jgi:hypothetical protein
VLLERRQPRGDVGQVVEVAQFTNVVGVRMGVEERIRIPCVRDVPLALRARRGRCNGQLLPRLIPDTAASLRPFRT